MNDQKNLLLAIVLSILIIVVFQFLYPQPTMVDNSIVNKDLDLQPAASTEEESVENISIKTSEEIIKERENVEIKTNSLVGSINLKGGILDDLILLNYKESLEENSNNITLLSPKLTANPYYIEIGWKKLSKESNEIELPDHNTHWSATNSLLSPSSPVTLLWTNKDNITFKIHYKIDNDYMIEVDQEIENDSSNNLKLYPYRLIKRINKPDVINFFILHEGLISMIDEELDELDYDDIVDSCSTVNRIDKKTCDFQTKGGWLGFTDKYWMTALIPNSNEPVKVEYRHNYKESDEYIARHNAQVFEIKPGSSSSYSGKIFAGAKVLKILDRYQDQYNIPRFNDSIDWGVFSFLTKPIFYAINWFYGKIGNFGLAIIGFTILMRLILFPLAQASFKSMAKMKKLQPEMQRLKELYGDDKQKMQQELMALYKKEGANPVAGCLPILLQIPIFFALYKTLFVTIEMYHAPFYGWIKDLAAPDPAGILILFGLIDWNVPAILSIVNIGILPIIMGLTMYAQQKLNPAPTDPVQAKIFTFLPIVFTFILAGFAAGLVLYWSVNNILSIAQQWFIQRKIVKEK